MHDNLQKDISSFETVAQIALVYQRKLGSNLPSYRQIEVFSFGSPRKVLTTSRLGCGVGWEGQTQAVRCVIPPRHP